MIVIQSKGRWLASGLMAVLLTTTATGAFAKSAKPVKDDKDARITALEAQVQALVGEVSALKAATTTQAQAVQAVQADQASAIDQIADLKTSTSVQLKDVRATQAANTLALPNGRPSFATGDGKFTANLHAVMQLDTGAYFQNGVPTAQTDLHARDLNSGANFRRARIGIDGKVFGNIDYNFLYDFGGGGGAEDAGRIQEVWLQYSGLKPLRFRIGAFAPSQGLEDANSTNGMPFLERPAIAESARSLAGADTRTGAAVMANGDRWFGSFAVTGNLISSINSAASGFNAQNYGEQLGYVARFAGAPFKGYDWLIHAGVNASVVAQPADTGPTTVPRYPVQVRDRPELRLDTTRLVDSGAIDSTGAHHYGLELAAQKANLYVQGEYFNITVDRRNPLAGQSDPKFSGWYVEGSWVLTGESRKYDPTNPSFGAPGVTHPFDPKKGAWGAWELAARYSTLDLNHHELSAVTVDRVRGGEQKIWTVGLNWYLNPSTRFMLDLLHVDVDRLNASGAQIGQDYDALALRSQLAF